MENLKNSQEQKTANKKPKYWKDIHFYHNFKIFCKNTKQEISAKTLEQYISLCDVRYEQGIKKRKLKKNEQRIQNRGKEQ